jgi:small conductance mechanosensitive channel
MDDLVSYLGTFPLPLRVGGFAAIAVLVHLCVLLVRRIAMYLLADERAHRFQRLRSIGTLATSAVVFSLYFFAVGLILREFGVSLAAYLASASVLGLAVGFGSQGVVQDVVTGLTFIFSNLIDVGDLVQIGSDTGIVKAITMRFVELENALGAAVFIPNRTVTNIVSYPRGYVRCIVDVTLRGDAAARDAAEGAAVELMQANYEQFRGIVIKPPSSEGRIRLASGKEFLRLKFRIWPNRGAPIESTFVQELTAKLKELDSSYEPWMIAVTYEVEDKSVPAKTRWSWRVRH